MIKKILFTKQRISRLKPSGPKWMLGLYFLDFTSLDLILCILENSWTSKNHLKKLDDPQSKPKAHWAAHLQQNPTENPNHQWFTTNHTASKTQKVGEMPKCTPSPQCVTLAMWWHRLRDNHPCLISCLSHKFSSTIRSSDNDFRFKLGFCPNRLDPSSPNVGISNKKN